MTPREWREKRFTSDEVMEMWCEFVYCKERLNEIKK
jgi:hypothetical protein